MSSVEKKSTQLGPLLWLTAMPYVTGTYGTVALFSLVYSLVSFIVFML